MNGASSDLTHEEVFTQGWRALERHGRPWRIRVHQTPTKETQYHDLHFMEYKNRRRKVPHDLGWPWLSVYVF